MVDDTLIVEVHDPKGRLDGSLVRMPDRPAGSVREGSNFILYPLFSSRAMVDARGETIALARGSKSEVQILDRNLNLKTIIRWIDPPREVKGKDIRASREYYRNARDPSPWDKNDDDMVSRDRPVADFFQLYPGLRSAVTAGFGSANTTDLEKIEGGSHLMEMGISYVIWRHSLVRLMNLVRTTYFCLVSPNPVPKPFNCTASRDLSRWVLSK